MAELNPLPLPVLLNRLLVEHERGGAIYDLPRRSMFAGASAGMDYGVTLHGQRAATPFGPAAGPHSQLAQNIVLAYLAGARIFELKTVQVMDELEIPRPCIDAATIGYNVEWSQELRVPQSQTEYVRAWILLHVLASLGEPAKDREFVFDLSAGYNLEGIKGAKVTGFIQDMMNAGTHIQSELNTLQGPLRRFADLEIPPAIVECLTLSTFHGCPAHEIEGIVQYLMEELGLNVIIKLNPTLLGPQRLRDIVRGQLGYDELDTPDSAFANDLQWNQALDMIGRLHERAQRKGVTLGVKLTNTLIVKNNRSFFPLSEKEMYASGEPLHVLAVQLLEALRPHLPHGMPISFSAGIDKDNVADAVALGLTPVTVCTDLLRPGGYGRMARYFPAWDKRMAAVGAANVPQWILKAYGQEAAALELAQRSNPAAEAGGALHVEMAARLNTPLVAAATLANPRFAAPKNRKPPRKVGSHLTLFDCLNCDKCVPVCPNNANFTFRTSVAEVAAPVYSLTAGALIEQTQQVLKIGKDHQLANFADFCNECGNCDVFCPEDGGPYVVKPRFFATAQTFAQTQHRDGFLVVKTGSGWRMEGRIDGVPCALHHEGATKTYHEGDVAVRLEALQPGAVSGGQEQATVHWANALVLDVLLAAVQDAEHVSWVNAPFLNVPA